ncbi:MAG: PD-(D/E)XK nuclease family protein [Deltaproteobacteria bacterium]|nr:PD-(D/E)XK nuclease family protein [Deltaproteobacteria bacterium]
MPNYSNSRLTTYENCPQQYKLHYIDCIKVPEEEEGVEAFLGSRVHETLEKLHKELLLTKLNSLDGLLEYYHSQWEKNFNENVVVTKKGFTADHYRNTGREAIGNYYKRYSPFDQSKTLSTEYPITFKIDDYTIRGFIDRLSHKGDGFYEIHDYKTSGSLPTQDKLDHDRQLGLYQMGVKEKFRDAKEITLIWHYLIFDKEFTSTRSDAQLEDLKKEVLSLIKTLEKDTNFSPKESKLCDWCEYPEYCPAKKHEIKVEALPLNEYLKDNGVTLVNRFASIKNKMQELKGQEKILQDELDLVEEAVVKYAQKEGVSKITGSDRLLKIVESEGLQFPQSKQEGRNELEEYIKKAGIWDQVSGLNLSRLSKMIEEETFDKKITDQLLKYGERIAKTTVRLSKKKEEDE